MDAGWGARRRRVSVPALLLSLSVRTSRGRGERVAHLRAAVCGPQAAVGVHGMAPHRRQQGHGGVFDLRMPVVDAHLSGRPVRLVDLPRVSHHAARPTRRPGPGSDVEPSPPRVAVARPNAGQLRLAVARPEKAAPWCDRPGTLARHRPPPRTNPKFDGLGQRYALQL